MSPGLIRMIEQPLPPSRRTPGFASYALAVAATGVTLLLRVVLSGWIGDRPLLILFLIPIILGSYVGGLGPGLVATLVAAAGTDYFLIPPFHTFRFERSSDVAGWLVMVITGVLVGVLTEALHRARRRAEALAVVTERNSRALRDSEERLLAVIESMSEGLVISDLDGQLLHWNRAALDMHGFESREEGRRGLVEFASIFELATLDGVPLATEQWPMPRIYRGERVSALELRIRKLGQSWTRVFRYSGTMVRGPDGGQLAFLTIADITEQKRAEAEILGLNAELERRVAERTAELSAMNKELEAFSYSVSHDLRAPLRAIDGFSSAVIEDYGELLPDEGRTFLARVSDSARQMSRLIDAILAFSRMSRAPLEKRAIATGPLVREVIRDLEPEWQGRTIDFQVAELAGCQADRTLLKQVWTNLLANAIKYTRKVESAIVSVGSELQHGEIVYFVRDNGAGFDMRYAGRLFGVFQRMHRPDEFEGTGIGLAIVRRIVDRHGGRVWADAAPNHGATFFFTLGPGGPPPV